MLLHPSAEGREAPAFARVATVIAVLASTCCVLEHIAIDLLMRPLSPPRWAEHVAEFISGLRIEPDLGLFEPWQLWSHVLAQEGWWQLGAGVAGLLAVGACIEAELGIAAMVIATVLVLPLAGAGVMIEGSEPGLSDLVIGLGAVALARAPEVGVIWRLSYYAITEVGSLRLLRTPLALVLALYLGQELLRCHLEHATVPAMAWLGAAAVGSALGIISRRLIPPDPRAAPPSAPQPPASSSAAPLPPEPPLPPESAAAPEPPSGSGPTP